MFYRPEFRNTGAVGNKSFAEQKGWQSIALQDSVLLIQPEIPDWIVVSKEAAALLDEEQSDAKDCYQRTLLENALSMESPTAYEGRYSVLKRGQLKECWFHLTDNCNLSCHHCLFAASPAKNRSINPELLQKTVNEALVLGCKLFSFTGGEPFLYPDFLPFLQHLLQQNPDCHAAILTNGMLLSQSVDILKTMDRLHLQVSLDGLEATHNRLRGTGSYVKLISNLKSLKKATIPFTLSVAISTENIDDLPELVNLASTLGAASIHLLYHFVRGKGTKDQFINPAAIYPKLREAWLLADTLGLKIDNIETLRSQVFSTPGTRYDLSNTGWESIAIGPDGSVYPSPALVSLEQCHCGNLDAGLAEVWNNSTRLQEIRKSSLLDSLEYRANPLKFLVGGGDIDHSLMHGEKWVGHDPYVELYNQIALQLIEDQASLYFAKGQSIHLRMGDVRYDCLEEGEEGTEVALTHCNCLISLASDTGHSSVREFYGQAALTANEDIINPLAPAQKEAVFVPDSAKEHSYGCGSPVTDGAPKKGEILVDLGSGGGVECFMASEAVGKSGKVFGIDMTDEMLQLANSARAEVAHRLGFQNVEFKKGFLEQIPLAENLADVVISNCVINLSPDKRMTYQEIHRILKPGGRLVVSDIVTDIAIPAHIKNNVRYRGECLGGAMQQEELVAMMEAAGFIAIRFIKRFPYRRIENMDFYSLTYEALKPETVLGEQVQAMYRGPHGAIYTEAGTLLIKGRVTTIPAQEASSLDDSVFLLDTQGVVTNIQMENSCCTPQTDITVMESGCCEPASECCETQEKKTEGCMVCGTELHYFTDIRELSCSYCGRKVPANGCCTAGHFVCDNCHRKDGLEVTKAICKWIREKDLITLLKLIRSHPSIPMHGPEHHAMIPGIILAAFRNSGGEITEEIINIGIDRGAQIPGGVCGFWGACGAAIGTGIAVSTILAATPLTPSSRQTAQSFSAKILSQIAKYKGGRCCQRETWLALTETAKLSEEVLNIPLTANDTLECTQYLKNKECIRKACPLWETRVKNLESELQFVNV
jgi:MoaA/NifB/PqqE/SkfB family radical SAM enzyme/SAM-dependent methyltransferase